VCMDEDWAKIAQHSTSNPANVTHPQNLAYCIYTSGSTGKPKGVLIPQSSLSNHCSAASVMFGHNATDRILQFSSISFDQSVEEIFPAFFAGSCLVICPERHLFSPEDLLHLFLPLDITTVHLPVSLWHECVPVWAKQKAVAHASMARLKLLDVTGDQVLSSIVEQWADLKPSHMSWTNTYGPTESTCSSTIFKVAPQATYFSSSIGRPILHTQIYILDTNLEPVPVGVPGQLFIAGKRLARGYLKRPDLTAERFVPNPFGEPGTQMYASGDLARYRHDGNIEFLGRLDQQVKIRGFRIELGEIESALLNCRGVREAVVIAREDVPGDKILAAYIVSSGADLVDINALRAHLQKNLPEYMLPVAWVFLEQLPLSPSGKIERKALPKPDKRRIELGVEYAAPRTATETLLATIWAEVLKVDRVGVHDNFFALGGHSLLAVKTVARFGAESTMQISTRSMFEFPTVAQLSTFAESKSIKSKKTSAAAYAIPRRKS
jgi:amino acid adenylation domain-containing protein